MKTLITLSLLCTTLFAQDPFFPFSVTGSYVNVSKAPFRTDDVENQKLRYRQGEVALAYTHPINPICGAIFGAGFVGTHLGWPENPDFTETDFGYVNLNIGGYTNSFPKWTWSATFGMLLDTDNFDLCDYTLYQGVLYGKYSLNDWARIDVGFILEVGLNKEKIWPIIGFELTPCESWRLSAVYPVDISFEYYLAPKWTIAASARFLRNRHRVGQDEPNPRGIFEYHTWGAEGDLIFLPCEWIQVKGFAGSTFDGDLKLSDSNDKNSRHFKFDGSFYAGVSGLLSF